MSHLSSIRHARSLFTPFASKFRFPAYDSHGNQPNTLVRCYGALTNLRSDLSGCLEFDKGCCHPSNNVAKHMLRFPKTYMINPGFMNGKGNASAPYSLYFWNSIHSGAGSQKDINETARHSKPMDFVRGVVEGDGRDMYRGPFRGSYSSRQNVEQNPDFVHIKLMRNNTFITVTDSSGNKKIGASSGCLPEMKGGPKLSRYAAEATAEHVGRLARNMGINSVVVKVNGFTYFKKKRQAIMSFREGFGSSRTDRSSIVCIEDTTRRAHNGCRLPKKRRT